MANQTQNKASQSSQATRLLDPTIMAGLGNLELIARTIVRGVVIGCLLYTSPSPRDRQKSRMPSSA